jgi:hypothetical protein
MQLSEIRMAKNQESRLMTRLWLFLALLLALDLLGFVGLVLLRPWIELRVGSEVFKVLAEFFLIVGLGGLGSLVIDELNRGQERRQQTRERLRVTLSELVSCYNDVKSLRRRLRAEAIRPNAASPDALVSGKEYGALMQGLNAAQLSIEKHARLVEGNQDLYPDPELLIQDLGGAEKHLGKLISEWEKNLGAFRGEPLQRSLAELPILRCFIGDADTGFKPDLADPISRVLVKLSRAIAK